MAFELNPLAVQNAPVLRYLALPDEDRGPTVADAARRLERDESNLRKTFKALENAGIIDVARQLTPDGRDQLAALDRAGDPNAAGALTALHSDLEPHPLNPRKDSETAEAEEALDELRISIVKSGLLQPIVVRPKAEAGKWWIIAGERRWRAIGQAISDGDWDDDQPIEVTAREVDDRDHLLLALNENLQRSNMSAIEEGVAFGAAVNDFGLSTEELANRTGKSQRYVQQRIALLKLDQVDQDRMRLPRDHPDRLSFKAARTMTQTPREAPLQIGVDLSAGPDMTAEVEISRDAEGRLTVESVNREPGSHADAAAGFGRSLTDREALAFVEVVDKGERYPAAVAALAAEGYTEVADARDATRDSLVDKGLIAIRYRGSETPHARAYLMTSGAKAWLDDIGFYQHRDDVLFELRTRVHGAIAADQHHAEGTYATGWLTPSPKPDGAAGKTLVDVLTTWQNGTPYERLFDRHKPIRTASSFAPDLPWGEWRDRPLSDFIDADHLETFCLGNLPTGRDDYPDALIEVAPLLGGEGWVYGAGYSTSPAAHHERLRLVSDGKEAFPDRETAIAAGVDLIRDSLGGMNKHKLPVRIYDWTVAMLSPATRPAAKNLARDGEPEQQDLITPTPEEAEAIAAAKRLNALRETARAELRYLTASALQVIDQPDFAALPATRRDCANLALDLLRANEPAKAMIALAGALVEYRDGATRPTGFRGPDCDSGLTMRHRIRSLEEL